MKIGKLKAKNITNRVSFSAYATNSMNVRKELAFKIVRQQFSDKSLT